MASQPTARRLAAGQEAARGPHPATRAPSGLGPGSSSHHGSGPQGPSRPSPGPPGAWPPPPPPTAPPRAASSAATSPSPSSSSWPPPPPASAWRSAGDWRSPPSPAFAQPAPLGGKELLFAILDAPSFPALERLLRPYLQTARGTPHQGSSASYSPDRNRNSSSSSDYHGTSSSPSFAATGGVGAGRGGPAGWGAAPGAPSSEPPLNLRHIDAALSRLGRLAGSAGASRGGGDTSEAESSRAAAASPASADARRLAAALLAAALPAAVAAARPAPSPRDAASILGGMARLRLRPPEAAAAAVEALLTSFTSQLPAAALRDRAQVLHAVAALRLRLPPGALGAMVEGMDGPLGEQGRPQDVSMVLWALATLGARPSPAWLSRLVRSGLAPARLRGFSAQALSNSAWALATLGYGGGDCSPDGGSPAASMGGGAEERSARGSAPARVAWLGPVLEASAPLLPVMYVQELVNLLWAAARLRHRPPGAWLAAALDELARRARAGGLCAQSIPVALWSLAALRVRPGLPALQALTGRALGVRRSLTPQGVVLTLWSLARLRVQLPERVVGLLLRGGLGRAALGGGADGPSASGRGLGLEPMEGLGEGEGEGEAGAAPSAAASAASVGGRGRRGRSSGGGGGVVAARPEDLAGAALALALCRHVPPQRWLVAFEAAVARQLRGFGPRELVTLLYGISALGVRPHAHWLDQVLAQLAHLASPPQPQPADPPPPRHPTPAPLAHAPATHPTHLPAPPRAPASAPAEGGPGERGEVRRSRAPAALDCAGLALALWAVTQLDYAPAPAWVGAMAGAVADRARMGDCDPLAAASAVQALQQLSAAAERRAPPPPLPPPPLARPAAADDFTAQRRGRESRRRGREVAATTDAISTAVHPEAQREQVMYGISQQLLTRLGSATAPALATALPGRRLYGVMRAASLMTSSPSSGAAAHGRGSHDRPYMSYVSYITAHDHEVLEVYSIRSLRLLSEGPGGGGDAEGGGQGGSARQSSGPPGSLMVNSRECVCDGVKVLTVLQQSVNEKHFAFPPSALKGLQGLILLRSKKGAVGLGYETGNGIAVNVGYNANGSMYTSGPVPLKLSKVTLGVQLGFNTVFTLMAVYHYSQMEKLITVGGIVGTDINVAGLDYQHASDTMVNIVAGRGDGPTAPSDEVKVVSVSDSFMVCDFSLYGGSLGVDKELLADMYGKDKDAMDVLAGRVSTPEPLKGYMDDLVAQLTRLASL
ncbi:hypothetical protein HYH03_010128 [Edaphochlamys debaryana]|uniref:Ysc84 actin-binding domain-containing protein n=1 Tax=Edaphochlamys debaryana TaxID=47281 RepID=A0A836BXT8_9CHLO|nr:hypothetical protein HYH03_010128 [Edaphochlamys debaryana]|eukprot:KAG2491559.1 hypothetical protein HYH03_010128 [Edaphochlamys debaryana]